MSSENSPPVSPARRNKMLRALTDEQIHLARILYHVHNKPLKVIARRFEVSTYTVWRWVVNISEQEVQAIKQEHKPEQLAV